MYLCEIYEGIQWLCFPRFDMRVLVVRGNLVKCGPRIVAGHHHVQKLLVVGNATTGFSVRSTGLIHTLWPVNDILFLPSIR